MKAMPTIRREFRSPRSAADVWSVLKKFDRVHELAEGFVTSTEMEPSGARLVTFANGVSVREWLVSADDDTRRLVYAIIDHPRYTHYNAAAQVFEEDEGSRFVWTIDFLPAEMAPALETAMNAGTEAMRTALGGKSRS
jgi:hypothetical protein